MREVLEVAVFRYDPSRDRNPYYKTYEVQYGESMTVLDVLRAIYENHDSSLAFRSSCRIGKCGTCAVSLNGRPVLSCQERVREKKLRIEPLSNYPVLKDLIVDRDRFDRGLARTLEDFPPERPEVPLPERFLDYERLTECIECLVCDAACPVVAEVRESYLGPSVLVGTAGLSPQFVGPETEQVASLVPHLFHCLLCANCAAACPSEVKINSILLGGREFLSRRGMAPQALQELSQTIQAMHNISGEDNQERLTWSQNLERPLQGVQPRSEAKVLYFVGCVASFFPAAYGAPQSFTRLLETAGVDYALLSGEEWCCGYPLLINGMVDQAEELIEHNISRAKEMGAAQVVTTCPSCYYTWRYSYEEMIGEQIGLEVLHSTQFIESLIEEGKLELEKLPLKVTYHDPCDLGRRSGLYDPPRAVLGRILGLPLVEMADNRDSALCCGGGGNVETYDPVLTQEISQRRLSQALDAGAEVIVTACPQCQRTLVAAARRSKTRVRVLDLSELVFEAVTKGRRNKNRED